MGLAWERDERRRVLARALIAAYSVAAQDARSCFDDIDAGLMRDELHQTLVALDVPPALDEGKDEGKGAISECPACNHPVKLYVSVSATTAASHSLLTVR